MSVHRRHLCTLALAGFTLSHPAAVASEAERWVFDELPVHTCAMPPDDVRITVQMSSSVSQWYYGESRAQAWDAYAWGQSWLIDAESGWSVKPGLRGGKYQDFETAMSYYLWAMPRTHPTSYQGEQETSLATPYGDVPRFRVMAEVVWNGDSDTVYYSTMLETFFPSWLCLSVLRDDRMDLMALIDTEGTYWDGYLPGPMFYVMQSPETGFSYRVRLLQHPYGSSAAYMRSDGGGGYPSTYTDITAREVWSRPLDDGAGDTAGDTAR